MTQARESTSGTSATAVNDALRDHVTSAGFVLTLGKTHIATLVELDLMLKDNRHFDLRGNPKFSMFVPAMQALERRGLVGYTPPPPLEERRKPNGGVREVPVRRIWKITRAGRHVLGLLREAGIYAEYAGEIRTWSRSA